VTNTEAYFARRAGHYFHDSRECQLLKIPESTEEDIESITLFQVGLRRLLECPYCRELRGTKDGQE